MKKLKIILKAVIFLTVFALLFGYTQSLLATPYDAYQYQLMRGIFEEEEGTLDAVYIGSSNCYAFWNQNMAWEEFGITVYPYCSSSQPFTVTEYMIKEARKAHPDALYIVNINSLGDAVDAPEAIYHWLLDFMPLSKNKLELTDYLCDLEDMEFSERLEFYLPIVRYHGRWSELTKKFFAEKEIKLKAGNTYYWYFDGLVDIKSAYNTTDEVGEIPKEISDSITSLLDYCDEENVRVLFVTVPRAEGTVETVKKFNAVNKMIEERGYDTLNLLDKTEEIGLDLTRDYYNKTHTNVHGSLKFTYYFAEYLVENYGFEDKRGDEAYAGWDESLKEYLPALSIFTSDFELEAGNRDMTLSVPEKQYTHRESGKVYVSWAPVERAEGYAVYRKINTGRWIKMGELDVTEFIDTNEIFSNYKYSYRIVPFYEKDGQRYYGNFSYKGAVSDKVVG